MTKSFLIEPTKESPLIVVLEEFDIIISKIHFGTITPHKSLPSNIYDKTSWNQFFDRFDRRYYPWVILVLTSNVKPEVIDRYVKSQKSQVIISTFF